MNKLSSMDELRTLRNNPCEFGSVLFAASMTGSAAGAFWCKLIGSGSVYGAVVGGLGAGCLFLYSQLESRATQGAPNLGLKHDFVHLQPSQVNHTISPFTKEAKMTPKMTPVESKEETQSDVSTRDSRSDDSLQETQSDVSTPDSRSDDSAEETQSDVSRGEARSYAPMKKTLSEGSMAEALSDGSMEESPLGDSTDRGLWKMDD